MFVFVYGTLKKNEPNHHWLTDKDGKAVFFATGRTKEVYPLVIASKYNIPFLLDKAGTGKSIQGEVYEIDEKMLSNLDVLEEYPKLYTRREEEILLSSGESVKAITYFLTNFQPELLERPMWDSYSANGPHNLPYLARYLRDEAVDHRAQVKVQVQA